MRRFPIIRLLLCCFISLFAFSSCSNPRANEDYYIPQDEWKGLETNTYDRYDSFFINDIPYGNPDPEYSDEYAPIIHPERIEIKLDKTQYNMTESVLVKVKYLPAEGENALNEPLYLHSETNLERWNGTSWDRMITTQFNVTKNDIGALNPEIPENNLLEVGEIEIRTYDLPLCVTVIVPGTYRVLVYLNNEVFYAEFELTD